MTTPSVPPIALAGEQAGWCYPVRGRTRFVDFGDTYDASFKDALRPVYYAAPTPSASSVPFLSESDMAALFVFHSQAEDHEADGYTVDKEKMKRLAEIGVVNSRGFGRYETTAFGAWLVETDFEQNPTLPLRTVAEYNEIALLQANGATK